MIKDREDLTLLPFVSITKRRQVGEMELELLELACSGQSLKECLEALRELKRIGKEV